MVLLVAVTIALTATGGLFGSSTSTDGTIQFGTSYTDSGSRFKLHGAKSGFAKGDTVAWVAHLSSSVNPQRVWRKMERLTPGGKYMLLQNKPVEWADKSTDPIDEVANSVSVSDFEGEGIVPSATYRMTYLDGSKTQAQGNFTINGSPMPTYTDRGTLMTATVLRAVANPKGDSGQLPRAGSFWEELHVSLFNGGTEKHGYNPFDFQVVDQNGHALAPSANLQGKSKLDSGKLDPDYSIDGWIGFQVPKTARSLTVTWGDDTNLNTPAHIVTLHPHV